MIFIYPEGISINQTKSPKSRSIYLPTAINLPNGLQWSPELEICFPLSEINIWWRESWLEADLRRWPFKWSTWACRQGLAKGWLGGTRASTSPCVINAPASCQMSVAQHSAIDQEQEVPLDSPVTRRTLGLGPNLCFDPLI